MLQHNHFGITDILLQKHSKMDEDSYDRPESDGGLDDSRVECDRHMLRQH